MWKSKIENVKAMTNKFSNFKTITFFNNTVSLGER